MQDEPIFVTTIRDTSTKEGFFGGLELHKTEMLAGAVLTGKVISLKGPKKINKADRPRGGKKTKDERNFKALVTVSASGTRPCDPALTPITDKQRSLDRSSAQGALWREAGALRGGRMDGERE